MTVRHVTAFVAGVAATLLVAFGVDLARDEGPEPLDPGSYMVYRDRVDNDPRVKIFEVNRDDDVGKPGTVRGIMGWRFFYVPAGSSAASHQQMRFVFDHPAEILQVDISVDIGDPRLTLVEFAAAINPTAGYGLDRRADWLMHASWGLPFARSGVKAIDETATLPAGVHVDAGDFVGVVAWMGGVGIGAPSA